MEEIVDRWGLDLTVTSSVENDTVLVSLDGPDAPVLSEDDGRVLEALQYLVSKMTSRLLTDNVRVLMDADGFRKRRDDALRDRALEAGRQAREDGRKLRLNPLNPYERRVVHLALKEDPGIRTYSIGRGYLKRVTIEPVIEGVPSERPDPEWHDEDEDAPRRSPRRTDRDEPEGQGNVAGTSTSTDADNESE